MKTLNRNRRNTVCVLALSLLAASLASGPATHAASSQKSAIRTSRVRQSGAAHQWNEELIPINLGLPSNLTSGMPVYCSVTVQSVPSGGGEIQLMCDQPSLLTSPSSSWPCYISYADGASTTAYFTLTANSVSTNTTVHVYAGTMEDDPNDLSDWNVVKSTVITTSGCQ